MEAINHAIEEADVFRRMMGKISEAPVEPLDATVEYRVGENRKMRRRQQQQERRDRKKGLEAGAAR